jgi:hypothetical protein
MAGSFCQLECSTTAWRSQADYYIAMLHIPGGGVRLGGKEDGRDGGSDTIWRQRPSGSAPPEKTARRVLIHFRTPTARGSGYGGDTPGLHAEGSAGIMPFLYNRC